MKKFLSLALSVLMLLSLLTGCGGDTPSEDGGNSEETSQTGGKLVVYSALSFGKKPPVEKELKITIPENLDYTGLFDDLFAQYTSASELVSVRTTNMGSLYNLHYHITLRSPEIEKQLIDAIRCRNGNLEIVCGKVPQLKETL